MHMESMNPEYKPYNALKDVLVNHSHEDGVDV